MKAKNRLKRELRTARREDALRRLDELLAPLPEGAAEHLQSIALERTGWPPGMLQDDSRELSKWLASKPDAHRLARESAARIDSKEQ